MRNQEPIFDFSFTKIEQNLPQLNCSLNKLAKFTCFSKSCNNFALICQHKECECRKNHKGCLIIQIENIISNFRSRVYESQALQNYISEKIDQIIDYLSDLREKCLNDIKQNFKYFGLDQFQRDILRKLETKEVSDLTGKSLFQGYTGLKETDDIDKQMKGLITKLQSYFKELEKVAEKLKANVQKEISKYNFESKHSQKAYLFEDSKVVTSVEENDTLIQFFKPKRIKSMELLYRASENDFELQKFHQNCDNTPNIVIVIDQQYGNKIGGYTPLTWQKPSTNISQAYKADHSRESFLFSIPIKDKLTLTKPQCAIQIRNDGVIKFGDGSDLFLDDRANQNSKSFTSINYSYTHPNYKQGDPSSKAKFLGSPKGEYYFKVKEWEAWQIKFLE